MLIIFYSSITFNIFLFYKLYKSYKENARLFFENNLLRMQNKIKDLNPSGADDDFSIQIDGMIQRLENRFNKKDEDDK